ncbi:MAG: hypothetical protein ABR549_01315, partial [Mycobacteriales bacterium]
MRTPLLLIAPLALLTACSSGSSSPPQSLDTTETPSSATSTAPAHGVAPGAKTRPSAGTGADTSGASAAPTVTRAVPLSTKAPGRPAASKATAPGRYTYTSSGKVTFGATPQDASGTQTLTISPLKDDVQHSTLHSDDAGDTEQDIVVRDTGSYGASLKLTSPAFTKEFRPTTPVLLVPDPAVVGRGWSWSATSTDGATHVTATNKLVRHETLSIGGSRVPTVVLQTHLVLSGDVTY